MYCAFMKNADVIAGRGVCGCVGITLAIGQNKTFGHAKERGAFAPLKFFCARREVRPKGAKKSLSFSGAKV